MGHSERSASSLGTTVGHVEHVCSVAEGATPAPGIEAVSSSWQRSAKKYGLDPIDSKAPRILTPAELKIFAANRSISSSSAPKKRLINYTRLFAKLDIPSCSVIARASQSRIAANTRGQGSSNIGELGSAGCGPRRRRAQTASAPASSMSGPSLFTEASILGPDTLT